MSIFGLSPESFRAYKEGEGKTEASTARITGEVDRKVALYVPRNPVVSHRLSDQMQYQMAHLLGTSHATMNPFVGKMLRMMSTLFDMMETMEDKEMSVLCKESLRVKKLMKDAGPFDGIMIALQDKQIEARMDQVEEQHAMMRSIPSMIAKKIQTEMDALGIASSESLEKRQTESARCVTEATKAQLRSPDYIALAIKSEEAMVQAKCGKLSSTHREIIRNYWQLVHTAPNGADIYAEVDKKLGAELSDLMAIVADVPLEFLKQAKEGADELTLCQEIATRMRTHLNKRYEEMMKLRLTLSSDERIKCDYLCMMAHLIFPSIINQVIAAQVHPLLESEQSFLDHMIEHFLRPQLEKDIQYNEEDIARLPERNALEISTADRANESGDTEFAMLILNIVKKRTEFLLKRKEELAAHKLNFEGYARECFAERYAKIEKFQALLPTETPYDKAVCQFIKLDEQLKKKPTTDLEQTTVFPEEIREKLAKGTTVEAEMERMTQELQKKLALFSGVATITVVK